MVSISEPVSNRFICASLDRSSAWLLYSFGQHRPHSPYPRIHIPRHRHASDQRSFFDLRVDSRDVSGGGLDSQYPAFVGLHSIASSILDSSNSVYGFLLSTRGSAILILIGPYHKKVYNLFSPFSKEPVSPHLIVQTRSTPWRGCLWPLVLSLQHSGSLRSRPCMLNPNQFIMIRWWS